MPRICRRRTITCSVSDEEKEKLRLASQQEGLSQSELLRQLIHLAPLLVSLQSIREGPNTCAPGSDSSSIEQARL